MQVGRVECQDHDRNWGAMFMAMRIVSESDRDPTARLSVVPPEEMLLTEP